MIGYWEHYAGRRIRPPLERPTACWKLWTELIRMIVMQIDMTIWNSMLGEPTLELKVKTGFKLLAVVQDGSDLVHALWKENASWGRVCVCVSG